MCWVGWAEASVVEGVGVVLLVGCMESLGWWGLEERLWCGLRLLDEGGGVLDFWGVLV